MLHRLSLFANDSELESCLSTEPESVQSVLRNLDSCCRHITLWMIKLKLKLSMYDRFYQSLITEWPSVRAAPKLSRLNSYRQCKMLTHELYSNVTPPHTHIHATNVRAAYMYKLCASGAVKPECVFWRVLCLIY